MKKRLDRDTKIVIGFISILIVMIFVFNTGITGSARFKVPIICPAKKAVGSPYCSGNNIVQQYLSYIKIRNIFGKESCKSIYSSQIIKTCSQGCKDGICISTTLTAQTCIDSDGGKDYLKQGTITVTYSNGYKRIEKDSCNSDGTLREWFCGKIGDPAGLLRSENYVKCPSETVCSNGACIVSTTKVYTCQKLFYSGNPQDKINLFFISDGFNDQNLEYFYKNVRWGIDLEGKSNGLFSKTPYKESKNKFNIYTISSNNIFDCLLTHNAGPNAKPCDISKIMEIPKGSCGVSKVDYVVLVGYPYSPINPSEKRSGIWNADAISIVLADLTDPTWIEASINHEVGGHGIGGLGDEYYDFNSYKESWNIWPNIDRAGCPKWCSGIIKINTPCYLTYTEWRKCVEPYLDQTCLNGNEEHKCGYSSNIKACYDSAYQKELTSGRVLFNCDIGTNCVDQAGCYWGAGYSLANFRSTEESIMKSSYIDGTYGPIGVKEINKRIGMKI